MKNTKLRFMVLIIGFCASFQGIAKPHPTTRNMQPNIVFIPADDCTNWDIGCYGSKDSKTPNIDKLASEGIQFNRCYQAAPICSLTRHNIYY